ncbi:MAG: hypothetical protein MJA83_06305, partial [Gammaproteobacteria bacterium]|nr:hypothetical protein [Gammaproteobacteria bacterium]
GSIAHYIYLLKSIIVKLLTRNKSNAPPVKLKNKYSTAEIIRRILYSVPHGTSKSVFSEWLAFRKNHWEKIFEKSGFEITEATSSNLFHTGYGIMPALSIKARTRLAKILGSSTHIFVLKKRN